VHRFSPLLSISSLSLLGIVLFTAGAFVCSVILAFLAVAGKFVSSAITLYDH
jgi:hypothetical protein